MPVGAVTKNGYLVDLMTGSVSRQWSNRHVHPHSFTLPLQHDPFTRYQQSGGLDLIMNLLGVLFLAQAASSEPGAQSMRRRQSDAHCELLQAGCRTLHTTHAISLA